MSKIVKKSTNGIHILIAPVVSALLTLVTFHLMERLWIYSVLRCLQVQWIGTHDIGVCSSVLSFQESNISTIIMVPFLLLLYLFFYKLLVVVWNVR